MTLKELKLLIAKNRAVVSELPLATLVRAVRLSNQLYHDKAKPILTDSQYDLIKDQIRTRKPDAKVLTEVGATPTGRKKVALPYPLFSLGKFYPEDEDAFLAWVNDYPGPYVVSDKEDGASLEIIYDKVGGKQQIKIYTRGKNNIGQDVSHLANVLKIPQKVPMNHLAVRAEVIIDENTFAKYKHTVDKDYKTARGAAAGLVNTLHGSGSMLQHAKVIAYEIITPRVKPSVALKKLKEFGFTVVPYVKIPESKLTMLFLTKLFELRKKKSPFKLDGLVVEQDAVNRRPAVGTHSPDYAWAFKVDDENSFVKTVVTGVTWNPSKHGKLVPQIQIKPVEIGGITINNVTGHNGFFIEHGYRLKDKRKDLPIRAIGKGAIVLMKRAGEVIPHIEEVLKAAPKADMPKTPYKWGPNRVEIYSEGTEDATKIKRIASFFKVLGVENIQQGVVQQLTDAGYNTIIKILRASVDDFLEIQGFQQRKAEKLYTAIHGKVKGVTLPVLMAASGSFGQGFGLRRLAAIVKAYPKIMLWADKDPKFIAAKVLAIPGFKDITANAFAKGWPTFVKWLRISKIKPVVLAEKKATGAKLKGQAVCFTGFRDADLAAKIESQGGSIASGVTKATTILLVANKRGTSSKITKANSLGIPIYTAAEFVAKYKL